MRRFGRRGFVGRRRSFGRKKFARRIGAYEILCSDFPTSAAGDTAGHSLAFRVGPNGAQSIQAAAFEQEQPPDVQGATGFQQIVRVNPEGLTDAIPLWDNRLANKWQDDVTLASLRGYARPVAVTYQGTASSFNMPVKVRMAIVMLNVSEDLALAGGISSVAPMFIWTPFAQRQRILWQRDWYMLANASVGSGDYTYWDPAGSANPTREPRLASSGGSDIVRLKRCGRITRTKWPILMIGVKIDIAGADKAAGPSGLYTLNAGVLLNVDFQCDLRAYLMR